MRILFYLPVVTPWWFSEIIAPMLRALHRAAELHVMVAPLWCNTGIDGEQLDAIDDLDQINWHVVESDDPALFRTNAAKIPGLLDLVTEIAPDFTLARSADFTTPALFPGQVRYIMEGAAAPFETDPRWVVFDEKPFAHGALPAGADEIGARCIDTLGDLWRAAEQRLAKQPPMGWRDYLGVPRDRAILAVPLQYEHEENFFLGHSAFPRGLDLLKRLLAKLDRKIFLAVTDHPLNHAHVDRSAIEALIRANPERMALCTGGRPPLGATGLLSVHADAMLIDQSKSWSLAAFAGTPILRIGANAMAPWLNASEALTGELASRPAPDAAAARRWFGWHLGARIVDPAELTLEQLIAQFADAPHEASIAANLDRLHVPRKAAA